MRTSTFTTTITPIRGFTTTSAALNCIVYVVLALLLLCNYNRVAVVESFLPSVLQRQTTSSFITSNKAPFWFVVGKKMKKASNGIPMLFERRRQLQEQLAASSSSSSASSSTTTTGDTTSTSSCDNNINQWSDSITEYLNTNYYSDLLVTMAMAFTEIGTIAARKNAFSGGSYKVLNATISNIEDDTINLDVYVQIRSEKMPTLTKASFSLDADPLLQKYQPTLPRVLGTKATKSSLWIRRWNRLCWIVKQPSITGKLVQIVSSFSTTTDSDLLLLRENLYLNQVPHNRYVRKYFYELANGAIMEAIQGCSAGLLSNRMQMTLLFPELNPSMDAYRIGTLLELARYVAIKIAEQNLRVRICVQRSMGVGIFTSLPKQLSGVATLLEKMDWQSGAGEENEGMIGNYINFGAVGKEHVVNTSAEGGVFQDDVFIILCPQNMVGTGTSVIPLLQEMVEAVGDRPIILINPDLTDKVSSGGQQTFRGRKDRIDFCNSFQTIFHMECLYISGTSYFPIVGALSKMSPFNPWVAYQRRDLVDKKGEVYVPVVSSESRPSADIILSSFES